jgi:hypothetical protein
MKQYLYVGEKMNIKGAGLGRDRQNTSREVPLEPSRYTLNPHTSI